MIWKSLGYPFNFLLKNLYARSCGNICRILPFLNKSLCKEGKPNLARTGFPVREQLDPPGQALASWSLVSPMSMELPVVRGAWPRVPRGARIAESAPRAAAGATSPVPAVPAVPAAPCSSSLSSGTRLLPVQRRVALGPQHAVPDESCSHSSYLVCFFYLP